jgi:thymidylate synthase
MAMTNEILHTSHKTLITASSVHGVYANALKALAQYGVRHNPKANVITQNLHRVSIHLTPLNSETNPRGFFDKRLYCANRNLTNKVQNAEFAWYMTGTNSVECITPFIKNWSNFSDDGLTVNSNYGYIWKNQIQGVIKKLIADKYTRQGAIQIYDGAMANNMITKDVQCTLNITFEILPNQFGHDALHMTVNMRSNDVVYGLPIDMFCFGTLHELVLHELHLTYPNLLLGVYEHNAVSLHI